MKKALILLLACIMIASAFIACSPTDDPAAESPTNKPTSSSTAKIGNLDPSINLNEKEIVILSRDSDWTRDEISVDGFNADPINDAIYQRKLNVEKLINVTLVNRMVSTGTTINDKEYSVHKEIQKTIGPDCPYHIMASTAYTCFENTASGYYQNLLDIDHLDLSQICFT